MVRDWNGLGRIHYRGCRVMSIAAAFGIIGSFAILGLSTKVLDTPTDKGFTSLAASALIVAALWGIAWFISWVTQ